MEMGRELREREKGEAVTEEDSVKNKTHFLF